MRRRAIFYANLASALLIGLPLGVRAQTGSGNTNGTTGSGYSGTTTTNDGTGAVRVGDPYSGPEITFTTTPDIVVIPGTRVYYIRNSDYDMYRTGTDWYFRSDGRWYRGTSYSGPFTYVTTSSVPRTIRTVPARYRHHWTTVSSSRTRSRNASARMKSRHKARTTSYRRTTHRTTTRTHSSMDTRTTPTYDDSHTNMVDSTGMTH